MSRLQLETVGAYSAFLGKLLFWILPRFHPIKHLSEVYSAPRITDNVSWLQRGTEREAPELFQLRFLFSITPLEYPRERMENLKFWSFGRWNPRCGRNGLVEIQAFG